MNLDKTGISILTIVLNIILFTTLILGGLGDSLCLNVATIIISFGAVIGVLGSCIPSVRIMVYEEGRSIPRLLSWSLDLFLVVVLCYFGFWGLLGLSICSICLENYMFEVEPKQ